MSVSRREEEKHKNEVRECIKIVEERLDGRVNPDREVVYYSNPSKGGYRRRKKTAADGEQPISEEEEPADARYGSRSASKGAARYGRVSATSAGKEYFGKERNQGSAPKIERESEMAARSEYYQQKKLENLRKLQREVDLEAKHGGSVSKKSPAKTTKPTKNNREGSTEEQPLRKSVEIQKPKPQPSFTPKINPNNSLHRTNNDRLAWLKEKEEKASNKRILDNSIQDYSYQPQINPKSKDIAARQQEAGEKKRKPKDQFVKEFLENEKKSLGKPKTSDAPLESKNKVPLKSSKVEQPPKRTETIAQEKKPHTREASTGGRSAAGRSKSRDQKGKDAGKRQVEFESPPLKRTETEIIEDFRVSANSKANPRNKSKSAQRPAIGASTGDRDSAQRDRAGNHPSSILKSSSFREKEAKSSTVSQAGIPIKNQTKPGKKQPAEERILLEKPPQKGEAYLRQSTEKSQRGATPPAKSRSKTPTKRPVSRSKSKGSSGKKDGSSHKSTLNRLRLQNEEAREKKLVSLIYKDRIAPAHASPSKNSKQ